MGIAERISGELKKRLENGFYPPGTRFPSESMLAEEFSVNKMTMNKIVSMLAEQGYLVRGIRGAGTRVSEIRPRARGILVFLGRLTQYSTRILHGVLAETRRYDFLTVIETPAIDELHYRLQLLKNQGASGIISVGYGIFEPPPGMQLFCADYTCPASPLPDRVHFVNSDNFQGGREMMSEILRRGHREILIFSSERFVAGPDAAVTPRIRGFQEVMRENGITDFEERTFYAAPNSPADAKLFLRSRLKLFPDVSLICTDSDGSAELLCRAAWELRIECPGKIALTGFGDVTRLPIASINQNPERQGELAARHLIAFASGKQPNTHLCETVETNVVHAEHIPILQSRR